MPTYVYECKSCGQRTEVVQHATDDPLTTCEACTGELRKVFFPSRVVFKGSGWYVTDSKASLKPKEPASDPEKIVDTAMSENKAKPETKTEPATTANT